MSAIEELKAGIVIDATGESEEPNTTESEPISIDLSSPVEESSQNEPLQVNLSSLNTAKKPKTVVKPNYNKVVAAATNSAPVDTSAREAVNIKDIAPKSEDDDVDDSKSYEEAALKSINVDLNVDDPNSMFRQYVDEKEAEAKEWIAEQQEKERARQEEEELEKEMEEDEEVMLENNGSLVQDLKESAVNTSNIVIEEDEDISSLIDEDIEDDDEEDIVEKVNAEEKISSPVKEEKPISVTVSSDEFDIDLSDNQGSYTDEIEEEEDTTTPTDDTEEVLNHLKKLATERLKPIAKNLDISSFTVVKKPVTNITNLFEESKARVCKWVLPSQESVVFMKEFSGAELEKLRQYSQTKSSVNALNRRYHLIYDHIVSAKPDSFEAWLKSTPFEDVDHLFFAIYIASFKGANYLPEDCINKECKETFLTEDIDVMNMVEFSNDVNKKKFLDLYKSEANPTAGKGLYVTERVPISNNIAITFRQPSIYNIFEIASLPDNATEKYASILQFIPYIDTIYKIDMVNHQLIPITYKMYPENAQKTIRSKVQKYNNIFNTLSVDEFNVIKAYVSGLESKDIGINYVYPAVECPKCGTLTDKQNTTAEELVFTRYQLAALVNTSLN